MSDILLVELLFTIWAGTSIALMLMSAQREKIRQLEKELRHGPRNLR